jgi:hypothetical protein
VDQERIAAGGPVAGAAEGRVGLGPEAAAHQFRHRLGAQRGGAQVLGVRLRGQPQEHRRVGAGLRGPARDQQQQRQLVHAPGQVLGE